VLLALALIFLPIIFDGQGSYQAQLSSRIPDEPIIPVFPEPTQFRPVVIADVEVSPSTELEEVGNTAINETEDPVPVITSEPAYTREVPRLDEAGLPQGWSVRMGAFAEEDNALNLMERLRAAGYKAYIRSGENSQGSLTRVFVGPWLDRELVDQYQEELRNEFSLAGDIVRFEIEQL